MYPVLEDSVMCPGLLYGGCCTVLGICTVSGMFYCIRGTDLCNEAGDVACTGGQGNVPWSTVLGILYCIRVTDLCDEAGDVPCTGGQCNVSRFVSTVFH